VRYVDHVLKNDAHRRHRRGSSAKYVYHVLDEAVVRAQHQDDPRP
jgi:hypothetical protein